jgi:hypothetical protein
MSGYDSDHVDSDFEEEEEVHQPTKTSSSSVAVVHEEDQIFIQEDEEAHGFTEFPLADIRGYTAFLKEHGVVHTWAILKGEGRSFSDKALTFSLKVKYASVDGKQKWISVCELQNHGEMDEHEAFSFIRHLYPQEVALIWPDGSITGCSPHTADCARHYRHHMSLNRHHEGPDRV